MRVPWLAREQDVDAKVRKIDESIGRLYAALGLERRSENQPCTSEDILTITIIGEFNAGKSTLLNALLRQEILPTGIVPTTATINVLQHSPEPSITVDYIDGREVFLDYSKESLSGFKATEGTFDDVRCIRIGAPDASVGCRIIDTPGVNDVCQTRMDIVYGFIPRSDAVVFVMDVQQALKKSEVDFLKDRLLGSSLTKMAYVLNHIDRVSKTEADELVSDVGNRLRKIYLQAAIDTDADGGTTLARQISDAADHIQVFPVSAKAALRGDTIVGNEGFRLLEDWLSDLHNTAYGHKVRLQRRIGLLGVSAHELASHIQVLETAVSGAESDFENRITTMADGLSHNVDELASIAEQLDTQLQTLKIQNRERIRSSLEMAKAQLHTSIVGDGNESNARSRAEVAVRRAVDSETSLVRDALTVIAGSLVQSLRLNGPAKFGIDLPGKAEQSGGDFDSMQLIMFSIAEIIGLTLFGPLGLLAGPILAYIGFQHRWRVRRARLRSALMIYGLGSLVSSARPLMRPALRSRLRQLHRWMKHS